MPCAHCGSDNIRNKGFYTAKGLKVKRFQCKACNKTFSTRTNTKYYRKRKQYLARKMIFMYCEGVSLRAISRILKVNRKTVMRYFLDTAYRARSMHLKVLDNQKLKTTYMQFDEMETFETSKDRPLGIHLCVRAKTGEIISAKVCRIPIKALSVSKTIKAEYGALTDRSRALTEMLLESRKALYNNSKVISDEAKINRSLTRVILPEVQCDFFNSHSKELWKINHACLMLRQNISRLRRKTLATTKKAENLQNHIDLYIAYKNNYMNDLL